MLRHTAKTTPPPDGHKPDATRRTSRLLYPDGAIQPLKRKLWQVLCYKNLVLDSDQTVAIRVCA